MHSTWTDPLAPVRRTAGDLARGAPVISTPSDTDATWYPGTWLADVNGSTLHGLIKYVSDSWGGGSHVAAALAFKGYAYAAALPVVAGWLGHGVVPMLESERLRIGISDRLPYVRLDISRVRTISADAPAGGPPAQPVMSSAGPDAPAGDPATLAHAAQSSLLHGHLAEIVDALAMITRVGRRLLWGSLAESVAYIAIQLGGVDGARRALALLGEPVAGLVEISGGHGTPSISRRTCCLWFATETGRDEYCASCPVTC